MENNFISKAIFDTKDRLLHLTEPINANSAIRMFRQPIKIHETVMDIHSNTLWQCNHCGCVYDQVNAKVKTRYRDGSDYETPCCNTLVGDNIIGNAFGGNYAYKPLSNIVKPQDIEVV